LHPAFCHHVLGEFNMDGATISFQLCSGVFNSPRRFMKSAKVWIP